LEQGIGFGGIEKRLTIATTQAGVVASRASEAVSAAVAEVAG
jgi:hypothetical protein